MVRFDTDRVVEAIDPDETALVIVDMINEFVAEGAAFETPSARAMVPVLADLIDVSRDAGVEVVYLRQVNRPDGSDAGPLANVTPGITTGEAHNDGDQTAIYEDLTPAPGDHVVEKHQYDGFFRTELDNILRNAGVSTVTLAGVASHICCDSTMRGAFFRGYDVIVLEDCNATFPLPDQGWGEVDEETVNQVWFSTVASNFGDVLTADQFTDEIATESRASTSR